MRKNKTKKKKDVSFSESQPKKTNWAKSVSLKQRRRTQ